MVLRKEVVEGSCQGRFEEFCVWTANGYETKLAVI